MQVTITAGSSKTGNATIRALLEKSAEVKVKGIYRDLDKVPDDLKNKSNFQAICGSISNSNTLDFTGSDVVLAFVPPIVTGSNVFEIVERNCRGMSEAAERAGTVKKVVLLSSIGAEFEKGTGELITNHISEEVFKSTKVPELIIARIGYFMSNWIVNPETLKGDKPFFYSTLSPPEYKLPMIAIDDIGDLLAESILEPFKPDSEPQVFDFWGPEDYSSLDVQKAFSKALGKQVELKTVERNELKSFNLQVFPEEIAELYTEMFLSVLPGGIASMDSSLRDRRPVKRGKITLSQAIKQAVQGL